jgi:hypothetical protein
MLNVIPVGKATPMESIPNFPPRGIPLGNVVDRSKVEFVPTSRGGTEGFHASGAVGGGVGEGEGGAGAGGSAGAIPIGDEVSLKSQPAIAPTTAAMPLCNRRRLAEFMCDESKPVLPPCRESCSRPPKPDHGSASVVRPQFRTKQRDLHAIAELPLQGPPGGKDVVSLEVHGLSHRCRHPLQIRLNRLV